MITSDKIIIPVCNIPYYTGYYQPFSGYQPNRSFSVQYVYRPSEISDFILLQSPTVDSQSDSDNSISSTDINSVVISNKSTTSLRKSVADIKCCWQGCSVWFESLDQLSNHVTKSHAASGPGGLFYCGWEGCSRNQRGFNARYKMLVHVRTHTNEKPHQCCQCEKSFSRAENLKIHSRSHSGEKPYVCPVPGCHKAYSNSSDRFKHTRTHQVEKPYTCKVPGCPKRYTDPSSLRKHVKTYRHFADSNVTSTGQNSNIKDKRQIVPFNKNFSEKIIPNSEILTDVQNGNNEQALNNKQDNFSNYNDHRSIIVELKQDERVMNKEFDNSVISNEYEEPKMYEHINYPQNIYRYDNPSTDQYNYVNINDTYDNRTSLMSVNNYTYKNESAISVCNCMHSCCVANSLTKAADFLKLGALIDLSVNDLKKNSWNKLWTPYVQEELDTRKKYDEIRQEHMDIDLPLDLTVHRK